MGLENNVVSKQTNPQTFSVRIDITDAERKLTFTGTGDEETKQMFLKTIRRLSQRIENSNFLIEPIYKLEMEESQNATISISKEDLETILFAILML